MASYTRFLDSGVSALQLMADPPKAKELMLDFKQNGLSLLRRSPRSSMPPPLPAGHEARREPNCSERAVVTAECLSERQAGRERTDAMFHTTRGLSLGGQCTTCTPSVRDSANLERNCFKPEKR